MTKTRFLSWVNMQTQKNFIENSAIFFFTAQFVSSASKGLCSIGLRTTYIPVTSCEDKCRLVSVFKCRFACTLHIANKISCEQELGRIFNESHHTGMFMNIPQMPRNNIIRQWIMNWPSALASWCVWVEDGGFCLHPCPFLWRGHAFSQAESLKLRMEEGLEP